MLDSSGGKNLFQTFYQLRRWRAPKARPRLLTEIMRQPWPPLSKKGFVEPSQRF